MLAYLPSLQYLPCVPRSLPASLREALIEAHREVPASLREALIEAHREALTEPLKEVNSEALREVFKEAHKEALKGTLCFCLFTARCTVPLILPELADSDH